MIIYKLKNYEELSKKTANIIAAQINLKPNSNLGLATGSSPVGTYKELIKKYNDGDVDFSNIKSFNLDEYKGLAKDNDQSYCYFMRKNLFDHVNIKLENTFIPNGMNEKSKEECEIYENLIDKMGGIDLQLLGIGHNGHIGFNEPSNYFTTKTNCVSLNKETIEANARFFSSIDDVPKEAYTMGIKTIMKSKKIILIASGKEKASILKKAFTGEVTPNIPASILQIHPDVIIIGDEESLSLFNI